MPKLLAVCIALLLSSLALAEGVKEDPVQREMLDIAKGLRCAVCQNQPVSESNSDLARDMRTIIREKLEAGQSKEQIVQYFVDRYGNYVLMKPPYSGTGTLLWLLPGVMLVVAVSFAVFFLRSRLRSQGGDESETAVLSERDRERIRTLRDKEEK